MGALNFLRTLRLAIQNLESSFTQWRVTQLGVRWVNIFDTRYKMYLLQFD